MAASSLPYGAVLVLLAAPAAGWGEPDPPSARAQAALARAYAAIEVLFDPNRFIDPATSVEERPQASARLDRALDDLADALDDETALAAAEEKGMNAKLVAIAWDRRQHPERYRALLESYRAWNMNNSRVPVSPPPKTRHLKEEYRLAWEYRLLNPQVGEAQTPFDDPPSFVALRRIGNEASIPTLVYYFHHVCRDDDKLYQYATRVGWAWRALVSYRSAKGLAALLECLAWQKRQWAPLGPSYNRDYDPEKRIAALLSERASPESREQWRKVMTAFPRDKLSAELRRWLDDALKSR